MLQCWSIDPSKRPDFSELASTLDSFLESVAGYMEVQMNLVYTDPEDGNYEIIDLAKVEPENSSDDVPTGDGAIYTNQLAIHPCGSGQESDSLKT